MSVLSMAKTVLKSIFRGPYTLPYPVKPKEPYKNTRGHIEIDIESCIFCGLCQRRCPTGAIEVKRPESRWSINRLSCIQCGYCTEVCPKKCLSMENSYTGPSVGPVRDEYTDARISGDSEHN